MGSDSDHSADSTASAPTPTATWKRNVLAPSLVDVVFIAILFSLSSGPMAVRLLGDAGIGWHIRNGEDMLRHHVVTRVDSFSVTMGGHAWYAWEWLYDLLISGIHGWLGLNGVVFFTALIIAASFALTLRFALQSGGTIPVTLPLLMLSLGAASIHFLARPHVLSWLFAVIWFHRLDSDFVSSASKRRILWYPALMLLWANLHGGFLIGLVLLVIFFAGAFVRFLTNQDRLSFSKDSKQLGTIFALCLLASLVNPYGYRLYSHIYAYLTNRFLMDHIDEFLSPNFHAGAPQCFAVLLLLTLLALTARVGKLHPSRLLVIVFAAYSGLYASRNLPSASILLTLIISPILSKTVARAAESHRIILTVRAFFARIQIFSNRISAMEISSRGHPSLGHLWSILALIFGVAICVNGGRIGSHELMSAHFSPERFPVQAIDQIAQEGFHDAVFCPDYWGGYLIYRLYPKTKVVIDDRHDLYGEEFLKQYLRIIHVGPGWNTVLNQHAVNWVLIPTKSSLATILRESPEWTKVSEDATATLFKKIGN